MPRQCPPVERRPLLSFFLNCFLNFLRFFFAVFLLNPTLSIINCLTNARQRRRPYYFLATIRTLFTGNFISIRKCQAVKFPFVIYSGNKCVIAFTITCICWYITMTMKQSVFDSLLHLQK